MELKLFDYTKDPYTYSKVYDIHPLSKEGFTKYIGNDSYTHKYIKNKYDAKTLEKIYGIEINRPSNNTQQNFNNSNFKLNSNYEIFQNQTSHKNNKNETNKEKNENSVVKNLDTLKSELLPKSNTTNNFYKNENRKEINFESNHTYEDSNNKNNNKNDYNHLEDLRSESKRNCYSSYNRNNSKKTDLNKTNFTSRGSSGLYKTNMNKNISSNSNINKNNLNKFLSMRKKLNNKHNPKDNMRWETNYAMNIDYLKKNQNLFFDFNPQDENLINFNNRNKKKHDGFESFNIPRLENIQVDASKPAFHYTQRLVKSCTGRKTEKSTYNDSSLQNNLNKKSKGMLLPEHDEKMIIGEKIIEENAKLKSILNAQTNKDFLKQVNMPKISYVALQPKLIVKEFGLGGEGKFLGAKFNPDNFQTGRGNDRNRRNYVGGLYLN